MINDSIWINDKLIENDSLIKEFVWNEKYKFEDSRFATKIIADKNCSFSKLYSIILELNFISIYRFSFETNDLNDPCWINHAFIPSVPYYDSIKNILLSENSSENNDSYSLKVKSSSKDSLNINGRLIHKSDLPDRLLSLFNEKGNFTYIILPDINDSYGDIIEMMDLYLSSLNLYRDEVCLSRYKCSFDKLDLESRDLFQKEYRRKMAIIVN